LITGWLERIVSISLRVEMFTVIMFREYGGLAKERLEIYVFVDILKIGNKEAKLYIHSSRRDSGHINPRNILEVFPAIVQVFYASMSADVATRKLRSASSRVLGCHKRVMQSPNAERFDSPFLELSLGHSSHPFNRRRIVLVLINAQLHQQLRGTHIRRAQQSSLRLALVLTPRNLALFDEPVNRTVATMRS
jgi:hypothetical protein